MKRIAIFCDGTWSGLHSAKQTSIARFARSVMLVAEDGVPQVVHYQPGLGVAPRIGTLGTGMLGTRILSGTVAKWASGAFGWGLNAQLEAAYRKLIASYSPGDEIYVFGYSRGAYLARSLVGLIRVAGIPTQGTEEGIAQAIRFYRQRDVEAKLDAPQTLAARHRFSPRTATSPVDLAWRRAQGDTQSFYLRVRFLGVWDTVGALGVPGALGVTSQLFNRRFAFHNDALSQMVCSARHAVAIDERRRLYPPTLWRNLDRLNHIAARSDGLYDAPYRQTWFPGNHSVIGGNGGVPELSAFPAKWVLDGARKLNLHFERSFLKDLIATAQADIPVPGGFDPKGLTYRLLGKLLLADRDTLERFEDVSPAARSRYAALPSYRPGTLRHVMQDR